MKNWIDFLPRKSLLLKKKGKLLTCLEWDVMEAENKLRNAKTALDIYELELEKQALLNNDQEQINEAKYKCAKWNTTPINELINPNKPI